MREITEEEYEYLMSKAEATTLAEGEEATIEFLLRQQQMDQRNSVQRYRLKIRWQSVPAGIATSSTGSYPLTQTAEIRSYQRKITRQDVDERLRGEATSPALTHVTRDPLGLVGWTELDEYNFDY